MKYLRFIIAILLSVNLSGQILSQHLIRMYSKGDGPMELNDGLGKLEKETYYDSLGNITLELRYSTAHCLIDETSYSYDNENRILEKKKIHFYNSRQVDSSYVVVSKYSYKDSLLLSVKTYHNEKLDNEKQYSYNEKGLLDFEKSVNVNDKSSIAFNTIHYNSAGLPLKNESVRRDGTLNQSWYYKYDQSNLLLKDSLVSHQSGGYSMRSYKYDDNGLKKLVKSKSYNGEKESLKFIRYNYDVNGFLETEKWTNKNDSTLRLIIYKHDSLGRRILRHEGNSKQLHHYNDSGSLEQTRNETTRRDTIEMHDYSYSNNKERIFKDYRKNRQSTAPYLQKSIAQKLSPSGLLLSEQPAQLPNTGRLPWSKHYTYNSFGQLTKFNHRFEKPRERHYDFELPPDIEGQRPKYNRPLSDHFTWYNYNSKKQLISCQKQVDSPRLIFRGSKIDYLYEKSAQKVPTFIGERTATKQQKKIINSLDTLQTIKLKDGGQKIVIKYSFEKTAEMEEKGQMPYENIIRTEIKTHDGGFISIEEKWNGFILHSYKENVIQQLHYFIKHTDQSSTRFICHQACYEMNAKFYFQGSSIIQNFPLELNAYSTTKNFYFLNGKLVKEVSTPSCGHSGETVLHKYDLKQRVEESQYFESNGILKQTKKYFYYNDHLVKEYVIQESRNVTFNYSISYQ